MNLLQQSIYLADHFSHGILMKKRKKWIRKKKENPHMNEKKNIMMKTLLLITYYPGYYNDMGDYEIELNVVNKV